MPGYADDMSITVDGVESSLLAVTNPLVRAVVMALFTWRRAEADDPIEGERWGWWGDNLAEQVGDRIGSRLWLLSREKLTASTVQRAIEYGKEALAHLVEDGVATGVTVEAERRGLDMLAMRVLIDRQNAPQVDLRFANVWSQLNV